MYYGASSGIYSTGASGGGHTHHAGCPCSEMWNNRVKAIQANDAALEARRLHQAHSFGPF